MELARDSQRQAVYNWDRAISELLGDKGKREMSLDECRELVARVWADYRPDDRPPAVKDGRGTRRAWGSRWQINLPCWSRRMILVLHEIAHGLGHNGAAVHGPEFARLALELYARYGRVPKAKARALGVNQKPRRVRFAPPRAVPQPRSRAWLTWFGQVKALRARLVELKAAEPPKYRGNGR